jgi:hypothetical protein
MLGALVVSDPRVRRRCHDPLVRPTSRWQRWTGLLVLAFGSSLALPSTSAAEPTSVVVSPAVAPVGTPVEVTGAGCAGPVDLDVRGHRDPGGVVEVLRTTVQPQADGTWSAVFDMPDVAAYVAVTCDGQTPLPPVVAPSGVARDVTPGRIVGDQFVVGVGGDVDGSVFELRTETGELFASAPHVAGRATVVVPRTHEPRDLVALRLRQGAADGVDLPYVAEASTVQVPSAVSPALTVSPRIAPAGATTTASGRCEAAVRLTVTGQPESRHDVAPTFLDRTVPISAGRWSVQFPMPAEPSHVTVSCATDWSPEPTETIIAPTGATVDALGFPDADGTGWLLHYSPRCLGPTQEAFTPDGAPVPLRYVDDELLEVPVARPGPVVLLGEDELPGYGEFLDSRPQACLFPLPGAAVEPPTTAPPAAPAEPTARPAAAAPVAQRTPELPATGGAPLAGWAAGLVLAGAVLLLASRRPRTGASR